MPVGYVLHEHLYANYEGHFVSDVDDVDDCVTVGMMPNDHDTHGSLGDYYRPFGEPYHVQL